MNIVCFILSDTVAAVLICLRGGVVLMSACFVNLNTHSHCNNSRNTAHRQPKLSL